MCMRIVIASVALLGITTVPVGAATVKIGFINSITGPEAPIGENLSNGVALAVEDLAVKGIKVELVKEDDVGKPQISMSAMEKLATRDKVMGVVGPYTSACANAVAKVAEKYKVPLLVPVASKEEITRQGLKWLFRLSATTNDYASILLDMVTTLGKPKTIVIINESTDFGVSACSRSPIQRDRRTIVPPWPRSRQRIPTWFSWFPTWPMPFSSCASHGRSGSSPRHSWVPAQVLPWHSLLRKRRYRTMSFRAPSGPTT
jgi:hypothetical protein